MRTEEIRPLFLKTIGKWTGCDWPTRFGKSALNLEGLKPPQAILMAKATAGVEAADWKAAAAWLVKVERDAREAEDEAGRALDLATLGQWSESLEHARKACAIESRYHSDLIWQPLCDALEKASGVDCSAAGVACPSGKGAKPGA